MDVCLCITESLGCTAEIITTLYIKNYTSIKLSKKWKKYKVKLNIYITPPPKKKEIKSRRKNRRYHKF